MYIYIYIYIYTHTGELCCLARHNGLWYDPARRRTHDLPCEGRTR